MNKKRYEDHTSNLMALMLFLIFSVCILAVILSGAKVYRRLVERNAQSADRRACAMYIATKVRQNDVRDSVRVEKLEDLDALVLTEEIEGEFYSTWIYCHDGYLYEIYMPATVTPNPGDGEKLLPMQALGVDRQENILSVQITDARGGIIENQFVLRSGEADS